LPHDLVKRPAVVRRPPHDELLRAFRLCFHEAQPDAAELLRLVEDQPDRLLARLSGAPAQAFLAAGESQFNRLGRIDTLAAVPPQPCQPPVAS
jgi:hypothetical protein